MAAGGQNPIARSPRHLRLSQLEIASGVESLAFNTNIPPERVPLQSDAHHQNGRTRALIVSISSQQAPVLGYIPSQHPMFPNTATYRGVTDQLT